MGSGSKPTFPPFDVKAFEKGLASFKEKNKDAKIVICGAGVSGLYAAYTLHHLGFTNYEILEASSDIGGRLRQNTTFLDGLALDTGAEWIHHVKPRLLQDMLLSDCDLVPTTHETIEFNPKTWSTFSDGERYQRDWLRHLYGEYKFRSSSWRSYLDDYIYGRIDKDRVRLNAAITSVDYTNPDQIKITLKNSDEVVVASHMIITASVAVLQQDGIKFVPPMPDSWLKQLNKINFAEGFKAWFEFDNSKEKFYADMQLVGSLFEGTNSTDQALYFNAVLGKPTDAHVIGTLQFGRSVEARNKMNDDELIKDILRELDSIYPEAEPSKNCIKSMAQNWSSDPYVRGVYSVSEDHDKKRLRKGIPGRIAFAGEHLGDPQGVVQGAAISGRNAVKALFSS